MSQDPVFTELDNMLTSLEETAADCYRGILPRETAQVLIDKIDKSLEAILPAGSTPFRIYDSLKKKFTLWWMVEGSGYLCQQECKNIEYWLDILRQVINEYNPEFLQSGKREYFFSIGPEAEYHAAKVLLRIMRQAKGKLAIIDSYLGSEVFDYIDSINPSVYIYLLTSEPKQIFFRFYNLLKSTRQNIEAKKSTHFHDRFFIIDELEIRLTDLGKVLL
jgi:hypothetical protein